MLENGYPDSVDQQVPCNYEKLDMPYNFMTIPLELPRFSHFSGHRNARSLARKVLARQECAKCL